VLATCLMLVSCLAYSSTLKMKVTCSSEMLVDFQQTTRRYISKSIINVKYRNTQNIKENESVLVRNILNEIN
jgi:hypothetical protein